MTRYTTQSVSGIGTDMRTWDLSAFGHMTSHTSRKLTFIDPDHPEKMFVVVGDGFTFDNSGHATGGTISRIQVQEDFDYQLTSGLFQSFSMPLTTFMGYATGNDWEGLRAALFSGDDVVGGTIYDDVLVLSDGGNDQVSAGGGDDRIEVGSTLTADDRIDGGSGFNTLVLNGDYSGGLKLKADTITQISQINFEPGHSYNLRTDDANVAFSATLAVYGGNLGPADQLVFHGEREADGGKFLIVGGAGDDQLYGGAGDDRFGLFNGGNDVAVGGDGNDTFDVRGALTAKDRIEGGNGVDTVLLEGDYSKTLRLSEKTLSGIQSIQLATGHSYNLTLASASVVAAFDPGQVDGSALGADDKLIVHGEAAVQGIRLIGGAGNDELYGGSGHDYFDLSRGGADKAFGGDGDDEFDLLGALTDKDKVDGGAGANALALWGDYSSGMTLSGANLTNLSSVWLDGPQNYKLTSDDAFVPAGATMVIHQYGSGSLVFRGQAESDGILKLWGGSAPDQLTGGAGADEIDGKGGNDRLNGGGGDDIIHGGAGVDTLTGGSGSDSFEYYAVSESNQFAYDTITDFNWNEDKIGLSAAVIGQDPEQFFSGDLNDLATVFDASHLGANHMALATSAAQDFLVVDANGVAGYQAGDDLLIALDGSQGTPDYHVFYPIIILQSQ